MHGSRNLCQGGSRSVWCFFFFSTQLILQKSNGQFQRNLSFFKVPEGGPSFSREGPILNCLFHRNPYNLWFSRGGGSGPPVPPSGSALALHITVLLYWTAIKPNVFLLRFETCTAWKVSEFTLFRLLYEITQISSMTSYAGNEYANYDGKHVKWSYF